MLHIFLSFYAENSVQSGTWHLGELHFHFARRIFFHFLFALGPKVLEVCRGACQSMHGTSFLSENVLEQATDGIFGELEVPSCLHFTTLTSAIACVEQRMYGNRQTSRERSKSKRDSEM